MLSDCGDYANRTTVRGVAPNSRAVITHNRRGPVQTLEEVLESYQADAKVLRHRRGDGWRCMTRGSHRSGPGALRTPERFFAAREICALLAISKATFYRIPFFRTRKHYPHGSCVRYAERDVRLYEQIMKHRAPRGR